MTAVSADVTKLTKRENISDMDRSLPNGDEVFNYDNLLSYDIKELDFPMEGIEDSVEEDVDWSSQFENIEPPSFEDLFCPGPRNFAQFDDIKYKNPSTSTKCSDDGKPTYMYTLNEDGDKYIPLGIKPSKYEQTSQLNQIPRAAAKTVPVRSSLRSDDLESIGSSPAQFDPKFEKRTRSKLSRCKRSNPSIFNTPFIPSTSSNSSASENLYRWDASESDLEASLTEEMSYSEKRKQKKKRNVPHLPSREMRKLSSEEPGESRETKRCTHCAVSKTPQWREGPLGPKTLCNACGVRYRSGRLFPEYRPAASPTFVASVHSNSHKKVIELRNKGCQGASMGILSSGQ